MAEVFVGPSRLQGRVVPPPSKSIAHRVLIGAALSGLPQQEVERWGLGGELGQDLEATKACLRALLTAWPDPVILDCRDSASTLRFLLPVGGPGRSASLLAAAD